MIFNNTIGIDASVKKYKIFRRDSIRAIIMANNKLLMISNSKGDYKFPGGGIDGGENHAETIVREVLEETGHIVKEVYDKIGAVTERRMDQFEEEAIFEMESHYYLCEVTGETKTQNLDDYEEELEFKPIWISIDDAIRNNNSIMGKEDRNPWVKRELYVLNQLKDYFKNGHDVSYQ